MYKIASSSAFSATLFVISTALIFTPELRTLWMQAFFLCLWAPFNFSNIWRWHKAGALNQTLTSIYRKASVRPTFGFLQGSVAIMSNIALVLLITVNI